MALYSWFRFSRTLIAGLFVPLLAWVQPVYAELSPVAKPIVSSCVPFKGRKLTMVIPFKAGGPYDLTGRALEPYMSMYSGMNVSVSNVAGGSGLQGIQMISDGSNRRPMIGLINLAAFTSQVAEGRSSINLANFHGLGIVSTEHLVWVTKDKIDWLNLKSKLLLSATSSSPYARLTIPGQLLGINIKPLFGYEGSTEVWLGFLRGELDFAPMADNSAKRNLATGANARVSMIMTEHEHPDFPGVPYLGGEGGLIDLRFKNKPPAERRRAMELGSLAISLSDSTRTLIASKKLPRDLLSCLESAAQATLLDPDLAADLGKQKLVLAPLDAKATDTKMRVLQATLNKHSDYLKSIASSVKTER